jgi:hypothetical protein
MSDVWSRTEISRLRIKEKVLLLAYPFGVEGKPFQFLRTPWKEFINTIRKPKIKINPPIMKRITGNTKRGENGLSTISMPRTIRIAPITVKAIPTLVLFFIFSPLSLYYLSLYLVYFKYSIIGNRQR